MKWRGNRDFMRKDALSVDLRVCTHRMPNEDHSHKLIERRDGDRDVHEGIDLVSG